MVVCHCPLGQLQFAKDDGPGFAQLGHHRGIAGRRSGRAAHPRHAGRGYHAGGITQILHRHRHAVQGTQRLAAGDRKIGGIGFALRAVAHQADVGAEATVDALDAVEQRVGNFA